MASLRSRNQRNSLASEQKSGQSLFSIFTTRSSYREKTKTFRSIKALVASSQLTSSVHSFRVFFPCLLSAYSFCVLFEPKEDASASRRIRLLNQGSFICCSVASTTVPTAIVIAASTGAIRAGILTWLIADGGTRSGRIRGHRNT